MPHLVANEHYCMALARRMGLPAADVAILRTPRPVLVVRRFDRVVLRGADTPLVQRLHVVDTCQAADLPVSFKYERNLGGGEHVRHVRDGVSFELLFGCASNALNKAAARLNLLRWTLFQYLIGNSDAHGKNFSFFMRRSGLEPTPWYDLVSVVQYPGIDHELAMAFGDAFTFDEVTPFALADFAGRCKVDRRLLQREAQRLARLAIKHAAVQAGASDYVETERAFVSRLGRHVLARARQLDTLARQAAAIKSDYL